MKVQKSVAYPGGDTGLYPPQGRHRTLSVWSNVGFLGGKRNKAELEVSSRENRILLKRQNRADFTNFAEVFKVVVLQRTCGWHLTQGCPGVRPEKKSIYRYIDSLAMAFLHP